MNKNHEQLTIRVEGLPGNEIPNLARFAEYIGIVSQINGSLIDTVTVTARAGGPESTSADGRYLVLGSKHLPSMASGKPTAIAAWCGAALHGFAHSRYSPRNSEPLRVSLRVANNKYHRTWNMIEDARIERLLLRDFPGWTPHLMGAVSHILLRPHGKEQPNLSSVYPLLVGRTYLPAALRAESYDAFAAEHSTYIADAVRDLTLQYAVLVDPGSEDHDEALDIVKRMYALLGEFGSECGNHGVDDDTPREWTDPGDPSEDDDEDIDPDAEDDDGNQTVTDDDDADGGDNGGDGDDGDGDTEDGDTDADADDSDEQPDAEDDAEDGDEGSDEDGGSMDGDDEDDDDDDLDGDEDATGSGTDDDEDADDDGEFDGEGNGTGGGGNQEVDDTSRLADWSKAIDSALEQDERLNEVAQSVVSGPMPSIALRECEVQPVTVPVSAQLAESEIARELRVLTDGVRPGMRRRVDRGRFNVSRVVREGGATRPEEMFDRHDPGALRSTGCAVAMLADISGSMGYDGLAGAMQSVWSVDRAVESVRGSFKAWTFGYDCMELPRSKGDVMSVPVRLEGATQPLIALNAAQAWLSQQREPNRLCIIATDGEWAQHDECIETFRSMLAAGVSVAVFGIRMLPYQMHAFNGVDVSVHLIGDASDLGPAVGELLVNRVRRSVAR